MRMREPIRYRIKFVLRRAWHLVYPWTALNSIDRKLAVHLPERNGVFIEAGANDGLRQSNTYYFEKRRGWSGLLVEPVPRLAQKCRRIRPRSTVIETLLVSPDDSGKMMEIYDLDLMTLVSQQTEGLIDTEQHARAAESVQRIERERLYVVGRTLSAVIDQGLDVPVDLLSLDVEGFELDVLRGLDLEKHGPRFILVETRAVERVSSILESYYDLVEPLSHHDYLFVRRA